MAPSFLSGYFGFELNKNADKLVEDNNPTRALPASWYTSPDLYQLERRAIFSKKWLLITHKARILNQGDWLRYEVAGFQFIITRDRLDNIHALHNVCRHRAFPIVTKDTGNNSVLSCKYHGWCYGMNGKLAKAPGYQDMEDFDKSNNGLFPLHVHIDKNGFIWVNLDASVHPEVSWNDDFEGADEQPRFKNYTFDDYMFDHTWEMEGDYDWKILADNYNECYHCQTTHPDIPTIADLKSYYVETKACHIQHFGNPQPEQIARGLNVASTYFFPNASMNVSPHFFFIQRFVPLGSGRATMKYEVYRNKKSSDTDFHLIDDIYKRIMSEDKVLCANAQKNINAGVFINGELHPKKEKGPLYFQKLVRELLREHHELETKVGAEVWPAQQTLPNGAVATKNDIKFCSTVACHNINRVTAEM